MDVNISRSQNLPVLIENYQKDPRPSNFLHKIGLVPAFGMRENRNKKKVA